MPGRRPWLAAAALAALLPDAAAGAGVAGLWLTEGGKSHVRIEACRNDAGADSVCGRIVWLAEPNDAADGKPKHDVHNPDAGRRDRPILGMTLFSGFRRGDEPGRWEEGRIYNPEDGETYRCTIGLETADRLRLRGYVGLPIFGRTQLWSRLE